MEKSRWRTYLPTHGNQVYMITHARHGIVVEGMRKAGAPMATPAHASTLAMDAAGSQAGRTCCDERMGGADAVVLMGASS